MNKFVKTGIVIAGYILAFICASAAVYIRILTTQGAVAQASSGMYAFGDTILFLAVFGVLALIPTVLAFYFLRSNEKFWNGFAVICLAFSIAGLFVPIANTLINANGSYESNSFGLLLSLMGVLGIFGAPLFVVCFLLLAIISPSVRSRRFLFISAGIEILAELYVLVNFLLFKSFF